MTVAQPPPTPSVVSASKTRPHMRSLPLRVGTRRSPLALVQTRGFLERLKQFCPVLRTPIFGDQDVFEEHAINTTGDAVQDRALADIGGKGLFAKEIHEALADGRIDFAVHSLKDLETELPAGIVLACALKREDARDALIFGPGCNRDADPANPFDALPRGAVIGTSSVRRQAQLLHARPDLSCVTIRGNVQTRLSKVAAGDCSASLLALAGLKRLGLEDRASLVLDPDMMVPSSGQGIVGVTVRASDRELLELLLGIEDPEAKAVSTAERALLAELDGSCRTPIGGYAQLIDNGQMTLVGLVARADGSFLLKRRMQGAVADAARIGAELGASLRADCPRDIFA
jgi:hydroxymethylbilane synthase